MDYEWSKIVQEVVPTRRAFHLGALYRRGEMHLVHRHGAFCVNGWDRDGKYRAEGFRTRDRALAYMKAHTED